MDKAYVIIRSTLTRKHVVEVHTSRDTADNAVLKFRTKDSKSAYTIERSPLVSSVEAGTH